MRLIVLLFTIFGLTLNAYSQEAVRSSLAGPANATIGGGNYGPATEGHYNIKAGPILFNMSAGTNFTFNDNIGLSEHNTESDFIITPHVDIAAHWPVTAVNTLNLTVGLGYSKYMNHPEADSKFVTIAPGSMLDFNVYVGDFKFTFYDSFAFQQDPVDEISLANVTTFGRVSNSVGVNVDWDLNDIVLSLGYDHTNLWATAAEFQYVDSSTDTVTQRTSVTLNPTTTVGWGNSISFTGYDQNYLNSDWSAMTGPFATIQITPYLSMSVTAGAQYINASTDGQVQDNTGSFTSWYGSLSFSHRINNYLTETLSLSHTNPIGLNSNFVQMNSAQHTMSWQVIRDVSLGTLLFIENGEESGGLQAENVWRYGGGLNAGYTLTRQTSLGLSYTCTFRDSDIYLRDYVQNVVTLSVNYQF